MEQKNSKKDWYIRISAVPFNGSKRMHKETRVSTLEEANVELITAAGYVASKNADTRRSSTYYVEPLFHACTA